MDRACVSRLVFVCKYWLVTPVATFPFHVGESLVCFDWRCLFVESLVVHAALREGKDGIL